MSVIDSMFIPQRAFQLGFPAGLFILSWLLDPSHRLKMIGVAGFLLGLLPIVHAHTFLAVSLIAGLWTLCDLMFKVQSLSDPIVKKWTIFWSLALMLGVPLTLLYILPGSASSLKWFPGWYAEEKHISWFGFWWSNWGITPIMALWGFFSVVRHSKNREERCQQISTHIPFFLLFALVNLILFQSWLWDNTKILVWASVGFVGLAARQLGRVSSRMGRNPLRFLVIGSLFFVMSVSGLLDAYRLQLPRFNRFEMYSKEDLQLAEWVKKNTAPDSRWLTGPYHNNWLVNLTGRRALMTW